jgi:hypothetical protein
MINLRPEIEKIIAKHEKDFMLKEIHERFSDEDGVRLAKNCGRNFGRYVHISWKTPGRR